ncbi:hypothetical protein HK405_012931 [Cladochytrium tenue]|nr:hypothetical protein HK405_012931 [Cladochytrium tenue]
MGVRHAVLHAFFWAKVVTAMLLSLFGLSYLTYKVIDLHQNASPPDYGTPPVSKPVSTTSGSCETQSGGLARLQPPTSGKAMFGFSLDWAAMTPTQAIAKLGYHPAIFNTFMELSMDNNPVYDTNMLNWFASEVAKVGGILEVTMAPTSNISEVSDAAMLTLAQQLRDININRGVPVLLRYGHEMNGDWTMYGYRPLAFTASFQRMATILRTQTNLTAMVWGPNVGLAYPFTVSAGLSPPPTSGPEFDALDTNHDGVLNTQDDPYSPYYPGDEYVDWVGLSLYYYPLQHVNEAVEDEYFYDSMVGNGPLIPLIVDSINITPTYIATRNFYNNFAAGHKKPMILPETGSPFLQDIAANAGEIPIKMGWWNQLMSTNTSTSFPYLLAYVNFEEEKELDNHLDDWRLLNSSAVLTTFQQKLSTWESNLIQGTSLSFSCDGSVSLTT